MRSISKMRELKGVVKNFLSQVIAGGGDNAEQHAALNADRAAFAKQDVADAARRAEWKRFIAQRPFEAVIRHADGIAAYRQN